jgi:hypothetical protein
MQVNVLCRGNEIQQQGAVLSPIALNAVTAAIQQQYVRHPDVSTVPAFQIVCRLKY